MGGKAAEDLPAPARLTSRVDRGPRRRVLKRAGPTSNRPLDNNSQRTATMAAQHGMLK